MRVRRLITYDFEDEKKLAEQLGRSMNDGVREFNTGCRITVVTLPQGRLWWLQLKAWWTQDMVYVEDHPPNRSLAR